MSEDGRGFDALVAYERAKLEKSESYWAARESLSPFLRARIAEDEAPTFELVPYECAPGCCAPAGWVGHRCLICDGAAQFGGTVEAITEISRDHEARVHGRARVLAECEAKRQIVELHAPSDAHPNYSSTRGVSPTCAQCVSSHADMDCENEVWPCATLRRLASVYADHPDYDKGWKP